MSDTLLIGDVPSPEGKCTYELCEDVHGINRPSSSRGCALALADRDRVRARGIADPGADMIAWAARLFVQKKLIIRQSSRGLAATRTLHKTSRLEPTELTQDVCL